MRTMCLTMNLWRTALLKSQNLSTINRKYVLVLKAKSYPCFQSLLLFFTAVGSRGKSHSQRGHWTCQRWINFSIFYPHFFLSFCCGNSFALRKYGSSHVIFQSHFSVDGCGEYQPGYRTRQCRSLAWLSETRVGGSWKPRRRRRQSIFGTVGGCEERKSPGMITFTNRTFS